MEFNNNFPDWKNEGVTPPETLQTSGFKGGDKPPAAWLNWLTSLVGKCVKELQEKLHLHSVDNTNPHGVTKEQVGLDKIENIPDSERHVAFASESNKSRKVEYPLTVRFKGGSTEGTDLWTYDGSTSRSVNITAKKIGAAEEVHEHTLDDVSETAERKMSHLVAANSTDGISYTATVSGVGELYDGLEITVIPNMTSTQAAINLNVNSFGAKNIRAKINGYNSGNSGTIAAFDKWFGEGAPITLRYVAKFDNWQTVDFSRPSASGMYGILKVENGGTGANTVEEAWENLGIDKIVATVYVSGYADYNTKLFLNEDGTIAWDKSNTTVFTLPFAPSAMQSITNGSAMWQSGLMQYTPNEKYTGATAGACLIGNELHMYYKYTHMDEDGVYSDFTPDNTGRVGAGNYLIFKQ